MHDSLSSTMKSLRTSVIGVLGALLLAAAATGCSAATTSEEPAKPVAAEQAAATQDAPGAHAGMAGMLAEAAGKLDLTPQQKQTVDAIKADLQAKSAPIKEARAAYVAALADGVSKGAIDPQALATPKQNLTRAAEAFKPQLQDAMNRLHAALNADQRQKLVDVLGEERKEWKHEAMGGMHGHMKKMAAELDLSADQIQTIKSNLRAAHKEHEGDKAAMQAKHEEMKAHMQKLRDAFKGDAFDARALDIGKELPVMAGQHAEKAERFLSIVTPTLTAPQRAKLAAMIQKRGATMEKAAAAAPEEDE